MDTLYIFWLKINFVSSKIYLFIQIEDILWHIVNEMVFILRDQSSLSSQKILYRNWN